MELMGCEIRFEWFLGLSLFLESHATLERERKRETETETETERR